MACSNLLRGLYEGTSRDHTDDLIQTTGAVSAVITEVPNGPLKFFYDWRDERLG